MNAFTVLLTAFGLGLATCQDNVIPMTCGEKYDTLIAEFPMCVTLVKPNAATLAKGITSAKDECIKCVNGIGARRSELKTPSCNGMKLISVQTKFDVAVMNAKKTCSANNAHCAAAEDFLAGNKSTLARAQNKENTNMACTCVMPGMLPKECTQQKMSFNCAKKAKNASESPGNKTMSSETSDETSEDNMQFADETCLQLFARNRTDFCKSDCVKTMQDAGGKFGQKCRDDSPDY
eukprot:459940_1